MLTPMLLGGLVLTSALLAYHLRRALRSIDALSAVAGYQEERMDNLLGVLHGKMMFTGQGDDGRLCFTKLDLVDEPQTLGRFSQN